MSTPLCVTLPSASSLSLDYEPLGQPGSRCLKHVLAIHTGSLCGERHVRNSVVSDLRARFWPCETLAPRGRWQQSDEHVEIPNGYHKEIQLDNLRVIARGHWVGIVVPADLLREEQPSCLKLAASTVNMIPGCAFQDLC